VKITEIETIPVSVPINPKLTIRGRRGFHAKSSFLLVRIRTDEGLTGLGEVSCTPRWSGEDQVTAAHFINNRLAPLLIGESPTEVERLSRQCDDSLAQNFFTKAALEMALWDISAKALGLPLYVLLGRPVRTAVPLKWSISGVEPQGAAEIALWAADEGFSMMKVRVGFDPDEDVARVKAVRAAGGSTIQIGVDVKGVWSVQTATEMLKRLSEFDLAFAEQPVAPSDLEGMAEVRDSFDFPIIADESVWSPQDASSLIKAGGADVLSVGVGKVGGFGPALKIAALAQKAGLSATVGSNLEMGIGTAAMIHLAMATSGIIAERFPCDFIGPRFYQADLLAEPLAIQGGLARPSDGPGLGVELDEKNIERYRMR
jgi:muconate cycloisomerase